MLSIYVFMLSILGPKWPKMAINRHECYLFFGQNRPNCLFWVLSIKQNMCIIVSRVACREISILSKSRLKLKVRIFAHIFQKLDLTCNAIYYVLPSTRDLFLYILR